jgi:hypothetical protein
LSKTIHTFFPAALNLGLPFLEVAGHVIGYFQYAKRDYFKVLLMLKIVVDIECDGDLISVLFGKRRPRR